MRTPDRYKYIGARDSDLGFALPERFLERLRKRWMLSTPCCGRDMAKRGKRNGCGPGCGAGKNPGADLPAAAPILVANGRTVLTIA